MRIKILVIVIFVLQIVAVSCSSNTEQASSGEYEPVEKTEHDQGQKASESLEVNEDGLRTYGLVGNELFETILDTINAQPLTNKTLIQSKWSFNPFPECVSVLTFRPDGTGNKYNCEIEDNYSFIYSLNMDTLSVTEFHVPEVDNPESKTLKMGERKYVLNNNSLTLIGATMYNNAGIPFEPEIEVIIKYERQKNNDYE